MTDNMCSFQDGVPAAVNATTVETTENATAVVVTGAQNEGPAFVLDVIVPTSVVGFLALITLCCIILVIITAIIINAKGKRKKNREGLRLEGNINLYPTEALQDPFLDTANTPTTMNKAYLIHKREAGRETDTASAENYLPFYDTVPVENGAGKMRRVKGKAGERVDNGSDAESYSYVPPTEPTRRVVANSKGSASTTVAELYDYVPPRTSSISQNHDTGSETDSFDSSEDSLNEDTEMLDTTEYTHL